MICVSCGVDQPTEPFCDWCGADQRDDGSWLYLLLGALALIAIYAVGALTPIFA